MLLSLSGVYFLLAVLHWQSHRSEQFGDFVEKVVCQANGMEVSLRQVLPIPRGGMWDLEIENHPNCPGATKADVGGGYVFMIFYAEKELCGVEPRSFFTPSWVATAQVTLLLKDDNGTCIADSISCVYNTRFETSLLTFSGQVKSMNLLYGGSLEEDGADVETTVDSINSIQMDFYNENGKPLQHRNVKLGDPILFKIDVAQNKQVSKVLPEHCYFSSSSTPEERPVEGQTLTFVKNSCFNDKNGMVRAFLPKMQRSENGTSFEMPFPAFYFTEFGQNLFVHCTILACVGNQNLCDPRPGCFGMERRRRRNIAAGVTEKILHETADENQFLEPITKPVSSLDSGEKLAKEMVLTKYIIIEDKRSPVLAPSGAPVFPRVDREFLDGTICIYTVYFGGIMIAGAVTLVVLLVAVSCLAGRLARVKSDRRRQEQRFFYGQMLGGGSNGEKPPAYAGSVYSLPYITSF